jgi:hypothetical protein
MAETPSLSAGLAKFFAVTVVAALLTTALTNVYENRNATSEARLAVVRELSDIVASATTARNITVSDNAPAAYLSRRCAGGLQERARDNKALKDACDKSLTDALLQEQELGNQQRRDQARLLALAEVTSGQFGERPAEAIRRLEAGVRLLSRLTNSNTPAVRREIVGELVSKVHVDIGTDAQATLIDSVSRDSKGTYDVVADDRFLFAFAEAAEEVGKLTTKATASVRSAEVIGRDTSFTAAVVHTLFEPFILFALVLAGGFYWWSRRTPGTDAQSHD